MAHKGPIIFNWASPKYKIARLKSMGEEFTPTRNEAVTVGTSSGQVCGPKPDDEATRRKVMVIRNTSDDDTKVITIALGGLAVTANNGIVLRRYEHYSESTDAGFKCWNGSVQAISAVAGAQLSIFER